MSVYWVTCSIAENHISDEDSSDFSIESLNNPPSKEEMEPLPKWVHAMVELEDRPVTTQSKNIAKFYRKMIAINLRVNHVHYVSDKENYGVMDYWGMPSEFYKNGGDCEEYVIAKYYELYDLGVADKDMTIVVAKIKATGTLHALLLVHYKEKDYVLDNLSNDIKNTMDDYAVQYYVNRTGWSRNFNYNLNKFIAAGKKKGKEEPQKPVVAEHKTVKERQSMKNRRKIKCSIYIDKQSC